MSNSSANTRWWENYLVRYFLPSVAGMFIVRWLDLNTQGLIWMYLPEAFLGKKGAFNSSNLIAWLLFGSLYCYIASYPVLVFHATRVLDFKDKRGRLERGRESPHAVVAYFVIIVWIGVLGYSWRPEYFYVSCFLVTVAIVFFMAFQLFRLWGVYSDGYIKNDRGKSSLSYDYLDKLSSRRGSENGWSKLRDREIVESYRHLREHGNTAFIFVLEVALCPIFWFLLRVESDFNFLNFSLISVFLFLWSFPAALVYLLGQHLERRFSLFE